MCTGRIDLSFIVRAFAKGADGVIIGGCWPGECHYVTEGNYDALANVRLSKRLLDRAGLRPERLRIEWVGASEGIRFAELMTDFARQVTELGPLGQVEGIGAPALERKLAAVARLVPWLKLVASQKLRAPARTEKAINAFHDGEEAAALFETLVADQLALSEMLVLLAKGPLSPAEISAELGSSSPAVAKSLKAASRQGLVRYSRARGQYALARAGAGAEE